MKKKFRNIICMALCLCILGSILAGCGSTDAPETTKANNTPPVTTTPQTTTPPAPATTAPTASSLADLNLADTMWDVEGIRYSFAADGTMTATVNGDSDTGTYQWDGQKGSITLSSDSAAIKQTEEGLFMEGEDGQDYLMTYAGPLAPDAGSDTLTLGGEEYALYGVWLYAEDGTTFISFDGEGNAEVGDIREVERTSCIYTYDGTTVILQEPTTGETYYGYLDSDNDLNLHGMDSYFELQGQEDEDLGDGNWMLVDHGDGTMTFTDFDRNVQYTCPTWMTVITGGIGESTDAVIVGDNGGGYVIGDNVTNEWNSYTGSDMDFLKDYIDSYLPEFFVTLYGQWDDSIFEELSSDETNRLATLELNIWNDTWDIRIEALLYYTNENHIMVKIFLAPLGEDDQFNTLWNEVTMLIGVQ